MADESKTPMSGLSRALMMIAVCASLSLVAQRDGPYRSQWAPDLGPVAPGPTDPNAPSG
jgi:hypothetical protein